MDKGMFTAIGLSLIVVIGYYLIFPPPAMKKPATKPATTENQTNPQVKTQEPPAQSTQAPKPKTLKVVAKEKSIRVTTPLYDAVIHSRGGVLVSFKLHNHKKGMGQVSWPRMIPALSDILGPPPVFSEEQVEMVQGAVGQYPLALKFIDNPGLTDTFSKVLFSADTSNLRVDETDTKGRTLTLSGKNKDGITINKILTFFPDNFVVDYNLQVVNYSPQPQKLGVTSLFGEGPQANDDWENSRSHVGPIFRTDGSVDTESADDIENGILKVTDPEWLGITNNYFISAVLAEGRVNYGAYEAGEGELNKKKQPIAYYSFQLPQVELQPQKMVSSQFKMYMGPKKTAEMLKMGKNSKLETSLDMNLDVLAQPLLALMHWFYSFVGNYGVAIILLTIVVRVGLFPLTYKGMVSMKRMQKLQPKVAALKEKFKGEKEKLNKETIELYRKHKMNPLGGCLPIVLQIPIFFALFSALNGAVELRHASFMFWITDLSAKDPLYITPLFLAVTMFIQQKFTPTTLDPTQAKLMMWMPVVFTMFMFQFPSGLVVYWVTSNTLSILQQVIINRVHIPEPVEVPQKPKKTPKKGGKK